jgi:hypothetical protein
VPWPSRLRLALQLAASSVAVHELRYRLGHDHGAERSLSDHGHGYLAVLTPLLGLLLALAAAHFVWALWARRPESLDGGGRIATVRVLAAALLALHVGQEAVEGIVAFGDLPDLGTIFGDGGWTAVPACAVVAGVLSWLTCGARRLARAVLEHRAAPRRAGTRASLPALAATLAGTPAPLARHGAERAPPLATR